jgi:hypothetical protein
MTTEAFVNWLTHFIHYKVAGCLTKRYQIWIIAKWKRQTGMTLTLLCLPSQTTHELQPMFKPFFGPFEHYWDKQVLLFYSHSTDRILTSRDLARFSLKFLIKQPHQPTVN